MSMKLRDLIRKVRACKTAAEERAVIAKESAMIRTAIREEQVHFRHRNVAKLLFMHMLGYPTHFGQLECMKLMASPHFPEKRIGYLGMMLLLSEEADVLMLATNALKNDLVSENKFVSGLALCSIGNLATADMSRDLAPEVDKHLKSHLPYLRKKACLAMARCLVKCPDMVEDFFDRIVTLLKDKTHGVLITVVQLMTQVLMVDYKNAEEEGEDPFQTDCRKAFLRLVPTLVKMMRNLLSTGYSPEHDIAGISDPFLQVQLLTLLRLLGVNHQQASEEMNDVLAQVATNTETSKNAGNAILYECVQTIMAVESEDGLRVLAVNILGRFLLNKDNNIRYVALNTLARCIAEQRQSGREFVMNNDADSANNAMSALQRHRTTVVECLKDPDISIRMRALELIYHLVNQDNVEDLTAELLNYLVVCPREHKSDICTHVLKVVDRYSPDDRWKVDTLITTLTIAGREASPTVQKSTIVYISRASTDIQSFATHKLLKAIRDDDGVQIGLLSVGVWCIGEYGDLLLQSYSYTSTANSEDALTASTVTFHALDPMTIVRTVEIVTEKHCCPEEIKQRALTAYVKLTQRLANTGDTAALGKLDQLLKKHRMSHELELQLRSCEYNALLFATRGMALPAAKKGDDDLFGVSNGDSTVSASVIKAAKDAIARMPVVDLKVLEKRLAADEMHSGNDSFVRPSSPGKAPKKAITSVGGGDLLSLDDMFGGPPSSGPQENGVAKPAASGDNGKSDLDLLADIFSVQASTAPVAAAPAAGGYDPFSAPPGGAAPAPVNPMDLFGPAPVVASNPPAAGAPFGATVAVDPFASMAAPVTSMPMAQSTMPASMPVQAPASMFGASPVPTPAAAAVSPAAKPGVKVVAFNHAGISAEFECTKPDVWNKQKSVLIAHFKNSTGAPVYGMNMQVAVPKYVTMELEPPTSTTIPISGGNAKEVTQKVTVTNSMLGTKNLMLKLKVGFSLNGQKVETMATCSGFPAGEY